MPRSLKIRLWLFLGVAIAGIGFLMWSSDAITLQGEWTLYTVRCEGGAWQGRHCSGHLVAAERHHFVVDKAKHEVALEVVGAQASSGRLSQCTIADGRSWTCAVGGSGVRPITQQLIRGEPVDPQEGPGHALLVGKRTWYLVRLGVPVGSEASR